MQAAIATYCLLSLIAAESICVSPCRGLGLPLRLGWLLAASCTFALCAGHAPACRMVTWRCCPCGFDVYSPVQHHCTASLYCRCTALKRGRKQRRRSRCCWRRGGGTWRRSERPDQQRHTSRSTSWGCRRSRTSPLQRELMSWARRQAHCHQRAHHLRQQTEQPRPMGKLHLLLSQVKESQRYGGAGTAGA